MRHNMYRCPYGNMAVIMHGQNAENLGSIRVFAADGRSRPRNRPRTRPPVRHCLKEPLGGSKVTGRKLVAPRPQVAETQRLVVPRFWHTSQTFLETSTTYTQPDRSNGVLQSVGCFLTLCLFAAACGFCRHWLGFTNGGVGICMSRRSF